MQSIAEEAVAAPHKLDHLSWSGIKTYQTCPRRFHYRYIARVPEESTPATLVYGGAIHRAIERANEARIEGRQIGSVEVLLSEYDAAWLEAVESGKRITFGKTEDAGTLRELAAKTLKAFREHATQQISQIVAIEHEANFKIVPDAPPIKARMDLVEVGPNRTLVVTDYKTSRSSYGEDKVRENLPQLVLYAHATMGMMRDLGLEKIVPRLVVLTKGKTPKIQVLEPQATKDDVVRLKTLVSETHAAVQKAAFVRREGWQCKGCPYARRCLGGSGY